ncbi:MAG: phage major tail protein, TP901-1 family [Oscillospiraceae bacterium]|nr:phage major tail protein, TP901-1 family [Oscillospiraceae bacterium]
MATTYGQVAYCDIPDAVASSGGDWLLCIFTANGDKLLGIAGQQGLSISRSAETIDVTSKTTEGGWKSQIAGAKEWSIDSDGVYVMGSESHKLLGRLFESSDLVCLKVIDKRNLKSLFGGLACITDYSLDAPYDDAVTYSLTLGGNGALVDLTESTELDDGHVKADDNIPAGLRSMVTNTHLNQAFATDVRSYNFSHVYGENVNKFEMTANAPDQIITITYANDMTSSYTGTAIVAIGGANPIHSTSFTVTVTDEVGEVIYHFNNTGKTVNSDGTEVNN